jgi:hypothetical protein
LDGGSKGGEILLVDDLLALALVLLAVVASLLRLALGLAEEAEALQVLIETYPAGGVLDDILAVALTDLLVLLGVEDRQLLLLDPLGVHLRLLHLLLLIGSRHLQALVLIVLLQSQGLRLFRLLLGGWLCGLGLTSLLLSCFLGSLFDVLILVELVLDVADVAPSATLLAGLVSA